MNRRPPRSTRPVTLFPDTTLGRSGIRFKNLPGQFHQRLVLLEKPWQVHGKSPVIGLLIEITGTSPDLRGLKVRGYVYHIIIRPHVSQQSNKAALVELYEFLGDECLLKEIGIAAFRERGCKYVYVWGGGGCLKK